MAHIHCCRRFHITIITMISGDGIWEVGHKGCFWVPPGRRLGLVYTSQKYELIWRSRYSSCTEGIRVASGAQQATDRRCIIRCRWDHLIPVGRVLLLWVESGTSERVHRAGPHTTLATRSKPGFPIIGPSRHVQTTISRRGHFLWGLCNQRFRNHLCDLRLHSCGRSRRM